MRFWQSSKQSEETSPRERIESESGGWMSRARAKYGLGTLLVVAGLALVLFPEPVTSTAGVVLVAVGAFIWVASWFQ